VVPPLRARTEDIGTLAEYFLSKLSEEAGVPRKHLSPSALAYLQQGKWAGNVRELQHAIERAFILSGSDTRLIVEHFRSLNEIGDLRGI
jgi:two-component system response regulator PilR (NtrC family)